MIYPTNAECLVVVASTSRSHRRRWKTSLADLSLARESADLDSLHALLNRLQPSILLLDADLMRLSPAREIAGLLRMSPGSRILYFSGPLEEKDQVRMLKAGVQGILDRDVDPVILRKAVDVIRNGDVWVSRSTLVSLLRETETEVPEESRGTQPAYQYAPQQQQDHVLPHGFQDQVNRLSARQKQIAKLLANGGTNKEIASNLGIAESTVKAHLTSIFRKVGVSDRLSLALIFTQIQAHGHP